MVISVPAAHRFHKDTVLAEYSPGDGLLRKITPMLRAGEVAAVGTFRAQETFHAVQILVLTKVK